QAWRSRTSNSNAVASVPTSRKRCASAPGACKSASTRRAPIDAHSLAVALPIPPAAPVMNTVCPSNEKAISFPLSTCGETAVDQHFVDAMLDVRFARQGSSLQHSRYGGWRPASRNTLDGLIQVVKEAALDFIADQRT